MHEVSALSAETASKGFKLPIKRTLRMPDPLFNTFERFSTRVVQYLARMLEAAQGALEGLNKQAFMTELVCLWKEILSSRLVSLSEDGLSLSIQRMLHMFYAGVLRHSHWN